jgi:hypothetical protein
LTRPGLGTERVIWVVVAVHFPVGGDAGGFLFPAAAGSGVGGYRTKSADCPGGAGQGGVPAEPPGAVVHHDGDLGQVDVAVRVGQLGDPPGPGALGLGSSGSVRGRIRVEFRFNV